MEYFDVNGIKINNSIVKIEDLDSKFWKHLIEEKKGNGFEFVDSRDAISPFKIDKLTLEYQKYYYMDYYEKFPHIKKIDTNLYLLETDRLKQVEKLNELETARGHFYHYDLKRKLNEFPILNLKLSESVTNKADFSLLLFLLSDGLIAEDYSNYLSLYTPQSTDGIGISDKTYLIKLKSNRYIDFNYVIQNAEAVRREINNTDFDKQGIVNKSMILLYFSEKRTEDEETLKRIVKTFYRQEKEIIDKQIQSILSDDLEEM